MERLMGVDFGGPSPAARQRRKIVALEAERLGEGDYRVTATAFNARLFRNTAPGLTALELANELVAGPRRVVAFDFPFSLPHSLLIDASFAAMVGRPAPFGGWSAFNDFVCQHLHLAPPTSLARFSRWRAPQFWERRSTDIVAKAHAPLKHVGQVLFNMTLLGNAVLGRLRQSYDIVPLEVGTDRSKGVALEVYPGGVMRKLGVPYYKDKPRVAISMVLNAAKARGLSVVVERPVVEFCETYNSGRRDQGDHDGADAFVALVCAMFHREGLSTEFLNPEDLHLRCSEGAIVGI